MKPSSDSSSARAVDVHVGLKLRALRRELGLTQSALSSAIGVSCQQLQKYESADNRISIGALTLAAKALGVTPGYFTIDAPGVTEPGDNSPEATRILATVGGSLDILRYFSDMAPSDRLIMLRLGATLTHTRSERAA